MSTAAPTMIERPTTTIPSNEKQKSSPESNALDVKLKKLPFKDRDMAKQLTKYCSCWTEDTKHVDCLGSHREFIVIINNRYPVPIDTNTINIALSVLSRNIKQIENESCILKTALFTAELMEVIII